MLKESEDEYSTELVSGSTGKRITLMTAHASKGLEFDAVLLGGIHTNGAYHGMREKVGKMPNSFRYKKSYDQNKFNKSPVYFLEAEILKQKNFSESKRLLYVACTRAISKLIWVDLRDSSKELIEDQNSWIKALRKSSTAQLKALTLDGLTTAKIKNVSFVQKDSLGLMVHATSIKCGITSELSVTRLATLAECPFKFYLQNICKISTDQSEKFFESNEEEGQSIFYSSKERGTAIHLILSKIFKNELYLENAPVDLRDIIAWVQSLAIKYSKHQCSSEETIKFSFFNNMIAGTPDIFFITKNNIAVWDFKTGLRNEEDEASYWFQLMCYAYGIGKIYPVPPESQIEMRLLYVDEKKDAVKKLSYQEISRELFLIWEKTECLYQVNPKHCLQCEYSSICKKSCL